MKNRIRQRPLAYDYVGKDGRPIFQDWQPYKPRVKGKKPKPKRKWGVLKLLRGGKGRHGAW